MSTSLLRQAFGITGACYHSTEYSQGKVIFHAEMTDKKFQCPKCSNTHFIFRGIRTRLIHIPPIGTKKSFLNLITHRVQCKKCKYKYWPQLPFLKGRGRMTKSFVRYLKSLLQFATIKDVANFAGVGWDTVKRIHKEFLQQRYQNIPLEDVKYISIDEFSIRKRHKYMTVVTDIKTGQIIHAVEGRKKEDVECFFKKLKKKQLL